MKETGAAYIPFHNDPIDKALSDFINSLNDPERIKDLFVRESEGVYIFGTKKVYAKSINILYAQSNKTEYWLEQVVDSWVWKNSWIYMRRQK